MPKFLGLVVFLVLWFVLFECAHASDDLAQAWAFDWLGNWSLWCNTHVPVARTFSVLYLVGCALSCVCIGECALSWSFHIFEPTCLAPRTACPDSCDHMWCTFH